MRRALTNWKVSIALAFGDVRQRYQRSFLGPFWIVLGTAVFVLGFVILGSTLFQVDRHYYLAYLICSITLWQFIVASLSEATSMFASEQNTLLSQRMSLLSVPLRAVARNLIVFLHSAPLVLMVCAYNGLLTPVSLLVLPGLALLTATLAPTMLVIGLIATRLRDVQSLVVIALQFLVFFTPVYWLDSLIAPGSAARWMVDFNPFYHLLQIVRGPLLSQAPSAMNWLVSLGLALFSFLVAALVFPRMRARVVYWL